jgi:hypothetical protein
MKFLKFHEFLDRGGMLCPWGQKSTFWGVKGRVTIVTDAASLSHLDSDRIKHVSRVGTHRSNEWEGRHDGLSTIHAARDIWVIGKT